MTNKTIISAVENSFVPLLIINNTGGEDRKILQKYNEPAWNYQVIRFLSSDGKDVIPRQSQVNTVSALTKRMVKALEVAKQPVPKDLKELAAK